jgi:hypothetical protein
MAPIKFSIAFVLAAATIAPIVAQPIREAHEVTGNVDHLPSSLHRLHHERVHDQSSLEGDNKLGHKHEAFSHGNALEKHSSLRHKKALAIESQALSHKDRALAHKGKAHSHKPKVHSEPEM